MPTSAARPVLGCSSIVTRPSPAASSSSTSAASPVAGGFDVDAAALGAALAMPAPVLGMINAALIAIAAQPPRESPRSFPATVTPQKFYSVIDLLYSQSVGGK